VSAAQHSSKSRRRNTNKQKMQHNVWLGQFASSVVKVITKHAAQVLCDAAGPAAAEQPTPDCCGSHCSDLLVLMDITSAV
jgi:hypothetical protein